MKKIVKILMQRDGLSKEEAEDEVNQFVKRIHAGECPFQLEQDFQDDFGLEPDYFEELIFG